LNDTLVTKENIRELLGDDIDEAYIDKLIAEADYLNHGKISYGEFKQAFRDQMRILVSSIRSRSSLSEMSNE
jgi:Ca2+-binding EF-hand superfamily protein